MEGIIIYDSKYGATRKYAEWLAREFNLPIMLPGKITTPINKADYLLIGTPVYYGKFRIHKWLKRNVGNMSKKKLFFFIINATAPDEQAKRDKFVTDNIPVEIRNSSEIYFLPGRLIHKDLTLFDKLMLKIAERTMKDPQKKSAIRSDLDEVKKENLVHLIKAVNQFCSKH